jgi:Transposase DDE domain
MIYQDSVLVQLIRLVDQIPTPQPPLRRSRGRPIFYSEKLFMKALVIMIVRRLHKVGELLAVLEEQSAQMREVRQLLFEGGRFPSRRTFQRRLKTLPNSLPDQIGCLGRYLVEVLKPWESRGRAVALDSTVLQAKGGVWHKKDKQRGKVPHTSIDTEADWTKSGWHGWVYGWKLHLAICVCEVWIPLAARLTPANTQDNLLAPYLIEQLPDEARFVLGDIHYNAPNVREACLRSAQEERFLVTTKRGAYPHTDDGVEVRRIFHKLRSMANENFNEHFKAIFEVHGEVPTRGLINTQRHPAFRSWSGVGLPELAVLYRHERRLDINRGLKPFLRAA